MTDISTDDRFQTLDGMELNEVPDGYVIYDNDNERVHYLNNTAAIVYQMSDGKHSVDDIAGLLKLAFELDEDVDVAETLKQMLEAGLVCRVE